MGHGQEEGEYVLHEETLIPFVWAEGKDVAGAGGGSVLELETEMTIVDEDSLVPQVDARVERVDAILPSRQLLGIFFHPARREWDDYPDVPSEVLPVAHPDAADVALDEGVAVGVHESSGDVLPGGGEGDEVVGRWAVEGCRDFGSWCWCWSGRGEGEGGEGEDGGDEGGGEHLC